MHIYTTNLEGCGRGLLTCTMRKSAWGLRNTKQNFVWTAGNRAQIRFEGKFTALP
jgi:hypothetical protein